METETLLFIILAVFVALFIALFQYILKNKEKSQLNYWLSFLRFLSIFFILLLLINPSIIKKTTEIIKPNLLIAIDNSTSIKYLSEDKTVKNLVALLKNDKDLNDKFLINYYGFGTGLSMTDSLNFDNNQTNLSLPFQEFSKLFKSETNPVVIISDGNQTVGNNVEYINYKDPVFPFIVGDTTLTEDIYLQKLNVNEFTTINNKFPVELFINYKGEKSVSKKLNVYNKRRKIISKKIDFLKGENVKIESFFLTGTEKGVQYYIVKIEELKSEQNTLNNTKTFSINVIEEKSEILILTSIIHPDLGMLKKSIESNKQRSVTISNIADFKGEISDYKLVILYQPSNKFRSVFKTIETKKLNYFIISGISTDWNFLNNIQKNFSKNIISQSENSQPVFNSNYASFLSDDIGFINFAPLENNFGDLTFSIPFSTLLFQQIGTIKTEKPLLVTFENSNQRGAILLGENSWRWRLNSYYSTKTFELFDGFMANLMQYLVSNKISKRLMVSVEPIYYANETIKVSASYLDKNFNFDSRAKLWLTVSNKDNNFLKKIPFAAFDTRFVIELSNLSPAEYNFSVSVENQNLTKSGSFKILPFEVEQQFTTAKDKELKILANNTGGTIYYTSQQNLLIENLKRDERFKSIQKMARNKKPLINLKWILGLLLLTLSIEWFTRKYYGKI